MKLLFRQRFFSWFDSYDIYDEAGNTAYEVKGKMSWGHRLEIYDHRHQYVGRVKEEIFSLLPRFAIYHGETRAGYIKKELTLFRPKYTLNYNGWTVNGNIMGWDYQVYDGQGGKIAVVTKQLFKVTDTYMIDVADSADALTVLMIVLAIDAASCSEK